MAVTKFSNKDTAESVLLTFDYSNLLTSTTEVIVLVSWSISVLIGIDSTPYSMLVGGQSNTANTSTMLLSGGITGNTYLIQALATTSLNQSLLLSGSIKISSQV